MFWRPWREFVQQFLSRRVSNRRTAKRHFGSGRRLTTYRPSLEPLESRQLLAVDLQFFGNPVVENQGTATVVATLSAPSTNSITVALSFTGNSTIGFATAEHGVDYTTSAQEISILPGATSGSITLTSISDALNEDNESIVCSIDSITGDTNGTTTFVTAAINDDDPEPTLILSLLNSPLQENGGTAIVVATLSAPSGKTIDIDLTLAGTALNNVDYSFGTISLQFLPGETSQQTALTGLNDANIEGDETVIIGVDSGAMNVDVNSTGTVTATILDDESQPVVTLSLGSTAIAEGASTNFLATLSHSYSHDVVVPFTFTGTAGAADFLPGTASGSITITAGLTSGSITLTAVDDEIDEQDETVLLNVGAIVNASHNGSSQFTLTLQDNDPTPVVSVVLSSSSIVENGGATTVVATLDRPSFQDVVVPMTLSGTALANDYSPGPNTTATITILAGQTSGSLAISAIDDNVSEPAETVVIDIGTVQNATFNGTTSLTLTITDNETEPVVTFTAPATTINENGGSATLTATLDHPSSQDITIALSLSGTAVGADFTPGPGTVSITILAGETSGSFTFSATNDNLNEADETIVLDVTGISNAQVNGVNPQFATLIIDDDPLPVATVAVSTATIAEASSGSTVVTVTLDAPSGRDVVIPFTLSGSASSSDYTLSNPNATITILAGETSGSFTITAVNDALFEGNESIQVDVNTAGVQFATPSGATSSTVTITDNQLDPVVTVSFAPASIAENGGTATIMATLDHSSSTDVVIPFTFSGSADFQTDYTPSSATLSITIAAGQTSGSFTVTSINDNIDEADETVAITIGTIQNAQLTGPTQYAVSITDDDPAPNVTLTISSPNVAENGGVTTVTALLSNPSSQVVTVNLGISGTALSQTDYTLSANAIVIQPGETSGSVTITGIQDAVSDANETVIVDVASVTNGTENTPQQVTATLIEVPSVLLSISGTTSSATEVAENSTTTIVATITETSSQNVVVTLQLSGTAINPLDYSASSQTIVIPTGQLTGSISVTGLTDNLDESNETIIVDIASVSSNAIEASPQTVTVTLVDFEAPPIASLTTSATSIAENGGTVQYIATIDAVSGLPVTVILRLNTGGSNVAVLNTDYSSSIPFTNNTASITIPAGQTSASFTVTATPDSLDEANETITIDVDNVVNGQENGSQSRTVSITDDDASPTLTLTLNPANGTITENGQTVTLTGTISTISGQAVTIPVTFAGTGNNTDFSASGTSIVIPAGQTSGVLTLISINDQIVEGDKSVVLNLGAVVGAAYAGSNAFLVTITDDDNTGNQPIIRFNTATQTTTEGSTARAIVTMDRTRSQDTRVDFTATGTAVAGLDYFIANGSFSITILAGQTSASIDLQVLQDGITEPNETAILTLTGVPSGTVLAPGANTDTVTITGDAAGTIAVNNGVLVVTGTGGNDHFELKFLDPSTYVVVLNTISNTFTRDQAPQVVFDGGAGVDTALVVGSALAESVLMSQNGVSFVRTAGQSDPTNNFVATISNSEFNRYDAGASGGSSDRVTFQDSALIDVFVGGPASSALYGYSGGAAVFSNTALNVGTVNASSANGGLDQALFVDSAGNDQFSSSETSARFDYAGGAVVVASGFTVIVAQATAGGNDTATLSGSNSNDIFYGGANTGILDGANVVTSVSGFDTVSTNALTGNDTAVLVGTAAADTLSGSLNLTTLVGASYQLNAYGFDSTYATGAGGSDTAAFTGSTGDETFYGLQTQVILQGTGVFVSGAGFNTVGVQGLGGNDTAILADTSGNDTFVGGSTLSTLSGSGYRFDVAGFSTVIASLSTGTDLATLNGSAGADTLTADGTKASLAGSGYSNSVSNFDTLMATGGGGVDVANLSDSAGGDYFVGTGNSIDLQFAAAHLLASGFEQVNARSSRGGADRHTISAIDYALEFTGNWISF